MNFHQKKFRLLKTYGGFDGVVASESLDDCAEYPLKNFESIVRLQEPIFI